jgi:hypothetical protein
LVVQHRISNAPSLAHTTLAGAVQAGMIESGKASYLFAYSTSSPCALEDGRHLSSGAYQQIVWTRRHASE